MRWFRKKKKGKEESQEIKEKEIEDIEEIAEPWIRENELSLGWHYNPQQDRISLARIRDEDRLCHMYVVGATGTGKSKFLEFLIRQDIEKENGFGIIDPHGDLIEDLKEYLALFHEKDIEEKILYIDPADEKYTVYFNPLEKIKGVLPASIAAELVEAFKKIWKDSWGARMEDLMRNTFIALIEAEKTLADLPHFLTDEDFRLEILDKVTHPVAKQYFIRFNNLSPKTRDEWIESTLNKVNAFLSDDRIREMFSFQKSSFSLREIMDEKKILLIKLDRGKLKENADLLGSLFMAKIKMAAFSRSDISKEERIPFYLYIDEFQNFATDSFIETLSEARKYGLALILAHQNLSQLPRHLQDSILANCGIQIYFRLSRKDAERLAKEAFETTGTEIKSYMITDEIIDFDYYSYPEEWELYIKELQNLPNRYFYAKHKIEGGIVLLKSYEIFPAHFEFSASEKEYEKIKREYQFGKNYLRKRKLLEKAVEKEVKEVKELQRETEEEIEGPRTLEEIIASMEPLEKAILYAIGTGNYTASDIYEAGNKKLKAMGYSTQQYSKFKKKFYELSKLPPKGKGLIEFTKIGRTFYYWLSQWGEIAFSEKFGMPSDRVMNELGGGGKPSKAIALQIIKEWLEPEGYKIKKEDKIKTDLTESHRGYTDIVAEKDGKEIRIEIENRSPKEQIERNIRKNLAISNELYIIASDEMAKRKVIQVALKVLFRMKKENPNKKYVVKIAIMDKSKKIRYKERWYKIIDL